MPVIMPSTMPPADRWISVNLGEKGVIEVRLKRPVWEDLMFDAELNHGYMVQRMKRCLLDWRGVTDDQDPPKPVPYSWETFKTMAMMFPNLARDVAVEVSKAYLGLEDADERNLHTPPVDPSTVAANAQATSSIDV